MDARFVSRFVGGLLLAGGIVARPLAQTTPVAVPAPVLGCP
jgi:hypothetical protein